MDFDIRILPNEPSHTPDGELTLVGVARRLFADINAPNPQLNVLIRGWNCETQEKYISDYNTRLLPALGNRAVSRFTEQEVRACLERLRGDAQYEDSTISHYQHLTWALFEAAEQLEICPNILWGSSFNMLSSEEPPERGRYKLKKSFSVDEQIRIWNSLKKPPDEITGQEIGLKIMMSCGTRNNETCGVLFGAVVPMKEHPDVFVMKIYQTTKIGSAKLKAGGKTRNANRVIPIMKSLSDQICARRQFLEQLVASGELILPPGIKGVDDLPIVCHGKDYLRGCKSDDLSLAGKLLFRRLGIGEKRIQEFDALIHSDEFLRSDFPEEELKEKDVTTYVFRRNYVTMLELLNFSSAEIEYYIGHAVEEKNETRNAFTNEDRLLKMAKKLEYHPLDRIDSGREHKWTDPEHIFCEAMGKVELNVCAGDQVSVQIVAKEPADRVNVALTGPVTATSRITPSHLDYKETVDIRRQMLAAYAQNYKDHNS